ncbi:MAG: winged helix-turn-helix transcriptional regulator, partial [Clostridia bacterium]|nr:winged helix-turn-helix transcriptional regulator [Clostridia bacterium]
FCPDRHEIKVDGMQIDLTYKEFSLLSLFCENRGIVLTRSQLMDKVWGLEAEYENRTLDVHIRTLRSKLGEAGAYIETVRGIGYRMIGDTDDR